MKRTTLILSSFFFVAALSSGAEHRPALLNASARVTLSTGGSAVLGFVVAEPGVFLVRAIGPGLLRFGVDPVAGHPTLQLFAGHRLVASNNTWSLPDGVSLGDPNAWLKAMSRGPQFIQMASQCGAFSIDAGSLRDAALSVFLPQGSYTVVASNRGSPGDALIEVYATAGYAATDPAP